MPAVQQPDHPAFRPTRYHWAAGLAPLHWVPALGCWIAVFLFGLTALGVPSVRTPVEAVIPFLVMAALAWSGYWLIAVPNMPRFKRGVDARLREEYENDFDYHLQQAKSGIHADLQGRVADIVALRNKTREMLRTKFGEDDPFAKDNLVKLDRLAISYLQMLGALTEYDQYVSLVDPGSIAADLQAAKLATQQSGADAALRDIGSKQVQLLESRMQRVVRAHEQITVIQGQLKNVETTMKLLLDSAMTVSDPRRLGRDIDEVLQNIHDSEVLSADMASIDDLEQGVGLDRVKGM